MKKKEPVPKYGLFEPAKIRDPRCNGPVKHLFSSPAKPKKKFKRPEKMTWHLVSVEECTPEDFDV